MPTALLSNTRIIASVYAQAAFGTAPATVALTVNHAPDPLAPTVGSTAGSADLIYSKALTINTASPTTIDLTSTVDPGGNAIVFAHITAIFITNQSTTDAETITVGGGTNGLFAADPVPIPAKAGMRLWSNPNPGLTVDSTHKILQIAAASGAAVPIQVTILGRSA